MKIDQKAYDIMAYNFIKSLQCDIDFVYPIRNIANSVSHKDRFSFWAVPPSHVDLVGLECFLNFC